MSVSNVNLLEHWDIVVILQIIGGSNGRDNSRLHCAGSGIGGYGYRLHPPHL